MGHEAEMKWVTAVVAYKVCGRSLEVPQECWGRAREEPSEGKTQNRHLLRRVLMFPLTPQAEEHYVNNTEAEFLFRECSSPRIN